MSEGANDKLRELWDVADEHLVRYRGDFYPLVVERAQGVYIYDQDGRAILDFSSGQMCSTLGHNHPAVIEALKRAGEKVIHLYTNMMSPMLVELADKLADLLPPRCRSRCSRIPAVNPTKPRCEWRKSIQAVTRLLGCPVLGTGRL